MPSKKPPDNKPEKADKELNAPSINKKSRKSKKDSTTSSSKDRKSKKTTKKDKDPALSSKGENLDSIRATLNHNNGSEKSAYIKPDKITSNWGLLRIDADQAREDAKKIDALQKEMDDLNDDLNNAKKDLDDALNDAKGDTARVLEERRQEAEDYRHKVAQIVKVGLAISLVILTAFGWIFRHEIERTETSYNQFEQNAKERYDKLENHATERFMQMEERSNQKFLHLDKKISDNTEHFNQRIYDLMKQRNANESNKD